MFMNILFQGSLDTQSLALCQEFTKLMVKCLKLEARDLGIDNYTFCKLYTCNGKTLHHTKKE